ncbi:MAG: hypothetical protein WC809_14070 [Sinimarinibacterium sp.]|jgi:hypothetical protein
MDTFAYVMLCALVCGPSLIAISSAVKRNRDGKPRSRAINVMLVASLLVGVTCGGALMVFAVVCLQVKTFVTLAFGLFSIMLSFVPLYIAYWALRALNGAERWHGQG